MTSDGKKVVAVSGGFDPIHTGHVRMIQSAAEIGDVIVILNTDSWLERKKGFVFMSWEERYEILKSIKGVTVVVPAKDYDETVCDSLIDLKDVLGLDYFANGGDRKQTNTPEMHTCDTIGIEMLWNVGGKKMQSSSALTAKFKESSEKKGEQNGKGRS